MPPGKNTDVESFEDENTIPSWAMVGYPGCILRTLTYMLVHSTRYLFLL